MQMPLLDLLVLFLILISHGVFVWKMLKAATKFSIMFQRNKMALLDVTDDNAERPWDHSYAYLLSSYNVACMMIVFAFTVSALMLLV